MQKRRVFVIVLDGFGIGHAPDAAAFGDAFAHTLKSVCEQGKPSIPTLMRLGLGCIDGIRADLPHLWCEKPIGAYARLIEKSAAKDTTAGHLELMGLETATPPPTYPKGFPKDILYAFSRETGRGVLCNMPYSGTQVIADYGDLHRESGDLIVYTSADSVFQIAAHEDIVSRETLYGYCRSARRILCGEHGVSRVIARPFAGESGAYYRTSGRRDFAIEPPCDTLLDTLKGEGLDVIGVGKIEDIFAGRGLTESYHDAGNEACMRRTLSLLDTDFHGLCFVNLVDFDMLYGHRRDPVGYAEALTVCDAFLSEMIGKMREEDALIVTADHGTDPCFTKTSDHTRECVPMLLFGAGIEPQNMGTVKGLATVSRAVRALLSGTALQG